ncbi:MAG: AAA family ATPase [Deltaproteobacteria bacterium]|nr:MAG: AAA family ATPase [Deltaproteobacteria bacterium]
MNDTRDTTRAPVKVESLVKKLRALRDALTEGLVERDVAVRLALLAALAGEHLVMVGPPGTAKSLVARRLHLAFDGSTYFERLLTRFTVPEELFGPLSIKGLEEDRYERLTDAYLPKASVAFLDEIFKANSAILNALLTLLNEREFDNGAVRERTPLVAVIGASNELPEGEELDALFDRFLLRLHVGPVSKDGFPALLGLRGQATLNVPGDLLLSRHELETIQGAAEAVEVPEDVVALLCDLRDWCAAEQIPVSDRRWRKIVKLLQVSAVTNGRTRVSIWDCWLLQHCVWDAPEAREKAYDWYAARVGASAAMDPSRLTTIVVSWEARLQADRDSRSQMRDSSGRPLFKAVDGKHTTQTKGMAQARRDSKPLFLAPTEAYENGRSYNRTKVTDRKNGGRGFTRNELDTLYVNDRNYGLQEFPHWSGRDAYLADQSNWLMEDIGLLPLLEPTRHKGFYIDQCIRELDGLMSDVDSYSDRLHAHVYSLEAEIREHLWVTPEFVGPAAQTLARTRQEVDTLLARVAKLREGFDGLPREQNPDARSANGEPKTLQIRPEATPSRGR